MSQHFVASNETTSEQNQGKRSRRLFLRSSAVGAGLVVPASLLVACSTSGTTSSSTTSTTSNTHQTSKTITTAQQSSYTTLALHSVLDSKAAFTEIQSDEQAHVTFLKDALTKAGATVRDQPTFKGLKQTDLTTFAALSQTLEDVGVGTYLMAAPLLTQKGYLASVSSILSVEARHAGFLNALTGKALSSNGAFDKPLTQSEIVTAISPYISSLNGGTDPSATLKTDEDVLNFALLVEYLQVDLYSSNVTTLFK